MEGEFEAQDISHRENIVCAAGIEGGIQDNWRKV